MIVMSFCVVLFYIDNKLKPPVKIYDDFVMLRKLMEQKKKLARLNWSKLRSKVMSKSWMSHFNMLKVVSVMRKIQKNKHLRKMGAHAIAKIEKEDNFEKRALLSYIHSTYEDGVRLGHKPEEGYRKFRAMTADTAPARQPRALTDSEEAAIRSGETVAVEASPEEEDRLRKLMGSDHSARRGVPALNRRMSFQRMKNLFSKIDPHAY